MYRKEDWEGWSISELLWDYDFRGCLQCLIVLVLVLFCILQLLFSSHYERMFVESL